MLRRIAAISVVVASLASCNDDQATPGSDGEEGGGTAGQAGGGQQNGGVGASMSGGTAASGASGNGGASDGGAGLANGGGSAGAAGRGNGGSGNADGGSSQAGFAGGGFAGTTAGGAGAVGGSGEPGTPKRIFVTAGAFPGNFYRSAGGLEAGDAQCNLSAAMLGGVWRAWLSSSSVDAIDRVEDIGPWYLVDRTTLVFDNAAQMATGPSAPIDMSEDGERLPAKSVWTGTAPAGTGASDTCSDWSSDRATVEGQVGRSNLTGASWTTSTVESCGLYAGLYCIEQ